MAQLFSVLIILMTWFGWYGNQSQQTQWQILLKGWNLLQRSNKRTIFRFYGEKDNNVLFRLKGCERNSLMFDIYAKQHWQVLIQSKYFHFRYKWCFSVAGEWSSINRARPQLKRVYELLFTCSLVCEFSFNDWFQTINSSQGQFLQSTTCILLLPSIIPITLNFFSLICFINLPAIN